MRILVLSLLSFCYWITLSSAQAMPEKGNDVGPEQSCYSSVGIITVGNGVIQIQGQPAKPATRTVGPTNVYRSTDGTITLEIPNPAFPGANCRIGNSPLPHGSHMTICSGLLQIQASDSEYVECTQE
jgi:hypothetical protein